MKLEPFVWRYRIRSRTAVSVQNRDLNLPIRDEIGSSKIKQDIVFFARGPMRIQFGPFSIKINSAGLDVMR